MSLREEHAARTRDRLLEAAVDLLVSDGADELSLREIARRAGVSAPTAYRHFPSKEAVYEALQAHFESRIGDPGVIRNLDDLEAALPAIHAGLLASARVTTAYLRARAAHELRDLGRKRRARRLAAAVKASAPPLADEELEAFTAVVHLFASTAVWDLWHETWKLDGARAGRVAAWAVRALLEAVRRNPKAFARAVGGEPEDTR
jgi:AcrR family transcriptional regulator